jgi:hypothetical protein
VITPYVEVMLDDQEPMTINVTQLVAHKLHPSPRKPQLGFIVLPGGREIFVTVQSYYTLLDKINDYYNAKRAGEIHS